MKLSESTFLAAARVRRALVGDGDIRAEIDFQNDINALLAAIEDGTSLLESRAAGPGVALQEPAETAPEVPAETLAATAASARWVGLRPSRLGPGSGRRGPLGREPTTPHVSLVTSVLRSA